MSTPIGSSQWMYAIDDGYNIDGSLRFNDNDNAYLKRDLTQDGNRKTYTISLWFKIGSLGTGTASDDYRYLYSDGKSSSTSNISLSGTDFLSVAINDGTATRSFRTNRLFRDVAAWYHIVVAVDTTQVTDTDRVKIYINGQQETSFSLSSYPTKDNDTTINKNGNDHLIGKYGGNSNRMWDGYIAEFHLIDGTALAPTSFGEDNNGQWRPIEYSSGSYGVNGFYLNFSSASFTDNASDPDVFADQVGSNDFNAYKFEASDIVKDSPSNNFATYNTLVSTGQSVTYAEGNLAVTASGAWSTNVWRQGTIGVTGGTGGGKYYFEFVTTLAGNGQATGVGVQSSRATSSTLYTEGVVYYNTVINANGSTVISGLTNNPANDVLRFAFDASNGKVWIGNSTGWFNSGDPAAGTGEVGTIANYDGSVLVPITNRTSTSGTHTFNFGQDSSFANLKTSGSANGSDANSIGDFYYDPPSGGFLAMCSANLPETTIIDGTEYFNTVLWDGDDTASRGITSVGHAPDFVWLKTRNQNNEHSLFDSVRGVAKDLESNSTAGEETNNQYGYLNSFDSDGFTVIKGSNSNPALVNASGNTYVGWNWKAGGSSNTFNIDGTGYATASAAGLTGGNIAADAASISKTAGISILKYTGDGSSSPYSTIKHGLDSPPELYICKSLDSSNADNWVFFHTLVDGTHDFMYLNLNNGNSNSAINFPPTSTTVKVGGNATNENNKNFLMIAMHSVQGFSKFGKYVGNGSSTGDGTYVNVGFKPAFVMVKRTSTTGNWTIWDATRNEYNVTNNYLFANEPNLEVAGTGNSIGIDILSNGWKFRSNAANWNATSGTYIYLAFAEMDFKYSVAR